MTTKQLIQRYIKTSYTLQIATSISNVPWVCTVCFAYDASFNLYWFSRHNARHSQAIAENPRVAGTVAVPYTFGDKPRGLQFSGTASKLQEKERIIKGLRILEKRYAVTEERVEHLKKELFSDKADYGLYCLTPDAIVLYDTLTFPDTPRHVYEVTSSLRK